jgi:hypothetical protein
VLGCGVVVSQGCSAATNQQALVDAFVQFLLPDSVAGR